MSKCIHAILDAAEDAPFHWVLNLYRIKHSISYSKKECNELQRDKYDGETAVSGGPVRLYGSDATLQDWKVAERCRRVRARNPRPRARPGS